MYMGFIQKYEGASHKYQSYSSSTLFYQNI